jgi:hypothetical protein
MNRYAAAFRHANVQSRRQRAARQRAARPGQGVRSAACRARHAAVSPGSDRPSSRTDALAALAAERATLNVGADHSSSGAILLAVHVDALRAAGFAEVGTLWQRGASRLLCGVR